MTVTANVLVMFEVFTMAFDIVVVCMCMGMFMLVCMSTMVVAEITGSQSCNEYSQTDEHYYALPTEMSLFRLMRMTMLIFAIVVQLISVAVSLDAAVFMIVLVTVACVHLKVYFVND